MPEKGKSRSEFYAMKIISVDWKKFFAWTDGLGTNGQTVLLWIWCFKGRGITFQDICSLSEVDENKVSELLDFFVNNEVVLLDKKRNKYKSNLNYCSLPDGIKIGNCRIKKYRVEKARERVIDEKDIPDFAINPTEIEEDTIKIIKEFKVDDNKKDGIWTDKFIDKKTKTLRYKKALDIQNKRSKKNLVRVASTMGLKKFNQMFEETEKKREIKRYSKEPTTYPQLNAWKSKREADKWDSYDWIGYWLYRWKKFYKEEEPNYIGRSIHEDKKNNIYIVNGIRIIRFGESVRGFQGNFKELKLYFEWIFEKFLPDTDWINEPVLLSQVISANNFFFQRYKARKVKMKKRRNRQKWHTWGIDNA